MASFRLTLARNNRRSARPIDSVLTIQIPEKPGQSPHADLLSTNDKSPWIHRALLSLIPRLPRKPLYLVVAILLSHPLDKASYICLTLDETTVPVKEGRMELAEIEKSIVALAMAISRSAFRLIEQLDVYDARDGYKRWGCASAAHWLALRCDWSLKTAREHVRIARALRTLPHIKASFADGRLSYAQTRAITRIATPDTEMTLLGVADKKTASQLEDHVRRIRSQQTLIDESEQRQLRSVKTWWEGGMFASVAKLPQQAGIKFDTALRAAAKMVGPSESDEASAEAMEGSKMERRMADALELIADSFLTGRSENHFAAETQVLIHVNADSQRAFTDQGQELSQHSLERELCDAILTRVSHGPNRRVDFGRSTRVIRPALRRAILERQRTCSWPQCEHDLFLRMHHVIAWSKGGPTDQKHLVPFCSIHHSYAHSDDFLVYLDVNQSLVVKTADGRTITDLSDRPTQKGEAVGM
ncbi:MAG: HNH endonuclease signature motif containing protein [Actinomycetota bacterium]